MVSCGHRRVMTEADTVIAEFCWTFDSELPVFWSGLVRVSFLEKCISNIICLCTSSSGRWAQVWHGHFSEKFIGWSAFQFYNDFVKYSHKFARQIQNFEGIQWKWLKNTHCIFQTGKSPVLLSTFCRKHIDDQNYISIILEVYYI